VLELTFAISIIPALTISISSFSVYYANGARNFYLKDDVPVTDTSVLSGKKIRSMPSSTSMDMIEKMGGTPVPMAAL